MKILLIHPILWSHYKAMVFNALGDLCEQFGDELLVLQVAESEGGRRTIGSAERSLHRYPLRLLFKGDFESTATIARCAAVCREVLRFRPDIVILPGYSDVSSWCALLVCSLLKIPRIITSDSTATDHRRVWHKEFIKKQFVRLCHGGFVYGSKAREYLVQLGMPSDKVHVRYQATNNQEIFDLYTRNYVHRDEKKKTLGLKTFNFIYVGRLSKEKNICLLMSAFAQIKQSVEAASECGLIIVGDGPLRNDLQSSATSDVIFVGGKSWREVPEYYALADVFILPSVSETWGLVVNEAMVCKLPVIVSSRCGAAHDLVFDSKNGFIFDPFSETDLVKRMKYFIEHPEQTLEMGKESQKIICDYTPQNSALQMHNALQKFLNKTDR